MMSLILFREGFHLKSLLFSSSVKLWLINPPPPSTPTPRPGPLFDRWQTSLRLTRPITQYTATRATCALVSVTKLVCLSFLCLFLRSVRYI